MPTVRKAHPRKGTRGVRAHLLRAASTEPVNLAIGSPEGYVFEPVPTDTSAQDRFLRESVLRTEAAEAAAGKRRRDEQKRVDFEMRLAESQARARKRVWSEDSE